MNIRMITIAAAAAVAAVGFAAPASATSLGAPVQIIGQSVAQSFAAGVDSPILQVGGKKHGKHGKWHGGHGKWHGHGNWHGQGYGFYPTYGYAPYPYGGCFKQVQVNFGGHYIWQTVKIC